MAFKSFSTRHYSFLRGYGATHEVPNTSGEQPATWIRVRHTWHSRILRNLDPGRCRQDRNPLAQVRTQSLVTRHPNLNPIKIIEIQHKKGLFIPISMIRTCY